MEDRSACLAFPLICIQIDAKKKTPGQNGCLFEMQVVSNLNLADEMSSLRRKRHFHCHSPAQARIDLLHMYIRGVQDVASL